MIVRFHKTASKRYSISAVTTKGEELNLGVAPGYDKHMPHDLQHFIVEEQLELNGAIFGQLAAGGDAGTFVARNHGSGARAETRMKRAKRKKGKALMTSGADEANLSEKATIIALYFFFKQSSDPDVRCRADEIVDTALSTLRLLPDEHQALFAGDRLERMVQRMQALSNEWRALAIGQFLEVQWR